MTALAMAGGVMVGAKSTQRGILLDVTDAQVALTQAQEAVITARFDYYSAYAALQKAVGADDLQKALAGGQN